MSVQYCASCVYSNVAANPLLLGQDAVCSGCRVAGQKQKINWNQRWQELQSLVDDYRSDSNYDILIPVGGGKDSYYQTHVAVKELGLKALLVTYHGNNYLPEAEENLLNMRKSFGCDHIVVRPDEEILIKLNRLVFKYHGDMNWHNHCGIETVPIQLAVQHKIPLILWGEHGGLDLGGMFSLNDRIEFTAKYRVEHALHGFDWHDFTDEGIQRLGREDLKEGITARDLLWAQYPNDDKIDAVGIRGIYLGNYVNWEANNHAKLVMEKYNWQSARQPFERTYRMFSNLDDMHENGVHDYLKYIKFGYGRATDHACKDIRAGIMSRDKGIEMVRKYDHVKPRRDLERWLNYVDMSEEEFDEIADSFRDPRVWQQEDGFWVKGNIWGERSAYEPVCVKHAA